MRLPTFRFDQRVAAELGRQRATIVTGLLCTGVASGLTSLLVPFVKEILNAVARRDSVMLSWFSLAVVALFGVKYWFTRGQSYYLSKAAARLTADLRVKLFEKLQRLPLSYFNDKRAGAIQSVLTNDVNVYQNAISIAKDAVDGPIKIVAGLAMVVWIQWKLAAAACVVIPLLAFVIQRNGRKMRVAQQQVQDDLSDLTAMMQESLQGTRIIKSFGAEDQFAARFRGLVTKSLQSQMGAIRRIAALRPTVELIGAVALAAVVYICGVLVARIQLDVPQIAAFIMGLDIINQGAKNLGSLNQTLAQVQAGTDRMYSEILDVPEPQDNGPKAIELEEPKGRIEFRHVSFAYPDGTPALKDVSFVIEPGTSLALVGPSGAGKSTVADLLLRFFDPCEGQVLFDGVDIRDLKVSFLRSQIGVVPQQTFLFAGTIRENILLGRPDASDPEVREAALAAHAEAFVKLMPETYETELGERGVRVSGGEMQRLAIARALVKKPAVLLLDEATSNLDAVSEKAVQEALDEIMKQRTTLFIAHRLTTAARADRILMLRRGEVVESGTHRELLERGGAYASMYGAFTSGVLDDGVL